MKAAGILVWLGAAAAVPACKPTAEEDRCTVYSQQYCGDGGEGNDDDASEVQDLVRTYRERCAALRQELCGCWSGEEICPGDVDDCDSLCSEEACDRIAAEEVSDCTETVYAELKADWDEGFQAVSDCVQSDSCVDYLDSTLADRIARCAQETQERIREAFNQAVREIQERGGCASGERPSFTDFWKHQP